MRRKGLTTPGRIGLTWIALWILAGARATAWGPTGHEIISRVALFHLTPVARDALDEALAPHA